MINGKEVMDILTSVIKLPDGSTTIWNLPDGYIFKDETGNVINSTKIVLEKKQPKYPQSYEECCKILFPNTVD